jgi:predicted exporter
MTRWIPLLLWAGFLAACGVVIGQTTFTADLSAFLPRATTVEQQALVDQLTEGTMSRLILVGIEAADEKTAAQLSRTTAQRLRASPEFAEVKNGEAPENERDRAFLLRNRYLLSPAITADRFSVAGLHAAIADSIEALASPAGLMLKSLLARDPTGELLRIVNPADTAARPTIQDGAWIARDGKRALLILRTQASGSDIDGQQRALAALRQAFAEAVAAVPAATTPARLLVSGPGVFAVAARETIRNDVTRLSAIGLTAIVLLLSVVYRSLPALGLGLLPVLSGAVAGVAAVSLGFGVVHGITLGFGTTLIGEAVDYSIYLFVQSSGTADSARDDAGWIDTFWPTVRLGMLTSVAGFAALLFSSFPGLAQLGLYSVVGLVVAAAVTRFVLPRVMPAGFRIRDLGFLGRALTAVTARAPAFRWACIVLLLAALAITAAHWRTLWNPSLAALSPVSAADQALDLALRSDLGAPDVRLLVVVRSGDREGVLRTAERVGSRLDALVAAGTLGGFDTPVRFLPSRATQRERQRALPPAPELAARLQVATADLPLRAERLRPFQAEVEVARDARPLERADLDGTSFALATDALLFERSGRWNAILPLRAVRGTGATPALDAVAIRAAITDAGEADALLIDLKVETDWRSWSCCCCWRCAPRCACSVCSRRWPARRSSSSRSTCWSTIR